MRKKWTLSVMAGIAVWLGLAGFPVYAGNLVEVATTSGNFKIFLAAIKTAGLTSQLASDGPYTVFMPTDHAFATLAAGQWDTISKDKIRLSRVLTYHLITGKVKVSEVKPGNVATLEGSPVSLKSDNGMVSVNDARVTDSDLAADNGVIHAIDKVLMPPD